MLRIYVASASSYKDMAHHDKQTSMQAVQHEATSAAQAFLQQKDLQYIKCVHFLFQPNGTGILYRDDLEPVTDTKHVLNIVLVEQNLKTERRMSMIHKGKHAHGLQGCRQLYLLQVDTMQQKLKSISSNILRQAQDSLVSLCIVACFAAIQLVGCCAISNSQSSSSLHRLTLKDFAEILAPAG